MERAEDLLEDIGWLRRLAYRLAGDEGADDLVQETWLAAWRREPDRSRPLRPWLRKVMVDTFRMRVRADRRRGAREQRGADDGEARSSDALLAEVRLHQLLVELVLALDEPLRATILMVFVDGRTSVDIARETGVPEGTVRWRLKEALSRLRAQLDAKHDGRKAWMLIALGAGRRLRLPFGIGRGLLATVAAIAVAVVVIGVQLVGRGRGEGSAVVGAIRARGVKPFAISHASDRPATHGYWEPHGIAPHRIRGHVVGTDGAPIAGATVQLVGWGSVATHSIEASASTGPDGAFQFQPREAGMYSVLASAPGHAGAASRVDSRAAAYETSPDDVDVVLAGCEATVEGTIRDSGGPIVGAGVRVGVGQSAFAPPVVADEGGRYRACADPDAEFVSIEADGYESVRRPLSPHGHQVIDVELAPEAIITGTVVDADTHAPVGDALVFVVGDGIASPAETRFALSDVDGHFELTGVAAGHSFVHVWSADHFDPDLRQREVFAVSGQVTPLVVTLPAAASVSGRVVAKGEPVIGASVQFDIQTTRGVTDSLRAVTGADGTFTATNVPRGVVQVVVRGAVVRGRDTFDTAHGDLHELTLELDRLAPVVRGHVVRDGAAVPHAAVALRVGQRTVTQPADATGSFAIAAPRRGDCVVSAAGQISSERALLCDADIDGVELVLER